MKLRYTRKGAAELDEILSYIARQSPQGSARVQQRIQVIVELLSHQPHVGALTSRKPLRRLVASPYPYLIFYQITDDEIIVHGIRHAARRPIV